MSKTTLTESLLYLSGATERMGRVEDGTTASDFDPEEARRKASLNSSVIPVESNGTKFNLIDVPGLFDFETGAADGAVPLLPDDLPIGGPRAGGRNFLRELRRGGHRFVLEAGHPFEPEFQLRQRQDSEAFGFQLHVLVVVIVVNE